jgi:serine/threonine protein kinase
MNNKWNFDDLILFTYEIAKGLFDMEVHKLYHLDLKPDNILIKSTAQYVLCDLGCSRKLEGGNNINCSNRFQISVNNRGGGTT